MRTTDVYGDEERIRHLLLDPEFETWAVVGLSSNVDRAAYGVARYLQSRGRRIIPVHPAGESVHGEEGFATLGDVVMTVGTPDVVDIFVRSDLAGDVVDEAIAIGARAVWMQLGVVDEAAAQRARAAGLLTVMDRCPAIEWPRLDAGGN